MIAVVVALREHLHLLASVPGVGGVVEDEHPVFLLLREMVKESVDDPRRYEQEKASPVDPGFGEKAVERILGPGQTLLLHHVEEALLQEDEGEEELENLERPDAFFRPGRTGEEPADVEGMEKFGGGRRKGIVVGRKLL